MGDRKAVQSMAAIMNVHDVATYLRLSEAKVYRMAKLGIVPAFRVGKSWRFKKDMIDDWIRQETRQASIRPATEQIKLAGHD